VTLDGEFGVRGRAGALPVELGPAGVRRVIVPSLTAQERVALENAL
jgi:malate/lactate dehydrogenase